ncbi:MAG: hypothetical protein GWO24_29700, partial [Akkermansiaceae bacterium]|nr:hypothetical protein [Akkermansiaceae bacterium]
VTIDQGVGDVTALTNAAGVGSIVVDPGPGTDTVYRMVVILPDGNSAASVSVRLAEEPVIFSLEADQHI